MKYKARQLKNGNWAVFAGAKKYFPNTETADKAEAEKSANALSAQWYLRQAQEILDAGNLPVNGVHNFSTTVIVIEDQITDFLRCNDPNFDENDPGAWKA